MKAALFNLIKEGFLKVGVRIAFNHPVRDPVALLVLKAREARVKTLLDVGANFGQFAQEVRQAGYAGDILSFEPLSAAHGQLSRNAASDGKWHVAPRMAIGDVPGKTEIHIAQGLASSSLLKVEERSTRADPISSQVTTEQVEIMRLDDAVGPEVQGPYAIKLDTQGFELHVLRGGERILSQTRVIVSELSLSPLYENGAEFVAVYSYLEQRGFRCIALTQGFSDLNRNEMLQVDGIFVKDA